ncbi:MAG: ShlB/FhaC/HecB family hemolysin secretion/activation protein [Candidatus Omnitrophota bacterium]|nr:ShlB/FhaC/HecB family hemolysin secretion/activation protein [Candidatus Omnitrophota bacterium]
MKNENLVLFLVVIFVFFCISLAFAQPGQEPGAQAQRLQNESEAKEKALSRKKIKPAEILVPEEKEKAVAVKEQISFTLTQIRVTGLTVFTPQQIEPLYTYYVNQKVTFKNIDDIASKIKAMYKREGYFTTTVYIPQQEIKGGVVQISVVEGKMGELKIEGNKYFSSDLIEKFFHVKKNEILNINKLQRDILRLNSNSDLELTSVLSPGKEPETSDITLKAKENFPFHIGANFDNQGTRLSGKWRQSPTFRTSNATGNFDSLYESSVFSSDSFGEFASYALPIGTYGTKFNINATYFKSRLGKEFKALEIRGISQIYNPYLSWELALREDFQASANLGMDIKSIKKKTSGSVTSSDQLRTPYFGFDFAKIDSFSGQTTFSPKFSFGTSGFLGASHRNHPTSSRAGTGGYFFKYEQALNRIQRMPLDSYLSVRTNFLAASHTLASSEQFQLGGANSIRGYPEGDYLADMGGSLNLDWVMPMYLIPKDWKLNNSQTPLRHLIEPVIFADVGGGRLKKVIPGELRDKFLSGAGGGFRFHFGRYASLNLQWARYTGNKPTSGSGPSTFYFTFQSEI